MRDFEEDFGFDSEYFGNAARAVGTKGCRKDVYKAMTRDPDRSSDPEHRKRVAAHTERIHREMKELGILHERNYT